MPHKLPDLPYDLGALEPHISRETLEFHYGKHHAAYVSKLNAGVKGTVFDGASLDDTVRHASGGIFNNAAQTWNHSFYWNCLSPDGGGTPDGALAKAINDSFGSFDKFRDSFSSRAGTLFGSGWAWLVAKPDGTLAIEETTNAGTPLTGANKPLMTCDVWEHAYYIDYRNERPKYIEAFWNLANWDFVARNFGD